jgi:hypothetical protein
MSVPIGTDNASQKQACFVTSPTHNSPGWGTSRIGRALRVGQYQARLVAKKYGIRPAPAKKGVAKKPKANPKFRGRVTDAEKTEIRRLTLQGMRQSVIARTLKIGAPSVSKAQRAMNLPTHIVIPEEKIMKLFRAGWAGYKISKFLVVPANQVFATAHKNNFHREDKAGLEDARGKRAQIYRSVKGTRRLHPNSGEKIRCRILQGAKNRARSSWDRRISPWRIEAAAIVCISAKTF